MNAQEHAQEHEGLGQVKTHKVGHGPAKHHQAKANTTEQVGQDPAGDLMIAEASCGEEDSKGSQHEHQCREGIGGANINHLCPRAVGRREILL